MSRMSAASVLALLVLGACAPVQLFPSEVMQGVDPNFDFSHWRMLPNQALERKIHLGGRIIQSEVRDGGITIVVTHLPIVEHPAYGPKEMGKRNGEFVVTYQGKIESSFLRTGNRLIVVGTTKPAKTVAVDDLLRSLPAVKAECLHLWNTGGRDIADFPSYGAGYETLEEQTYCISGP